MAYVKITNGSVDTYPYSVGQLRRDNPRTSFPKVIPNEKLEQMGIFVVTEKDEPDYNRRTQKIKINETPVQEDGEWVLDWTVINKTDLEITEYDNELSNAMRVKRNNLLAESDWTQARDVVLDNDADWKTYRQALRDITSHANFPYLNDEDWPTKP